LAQEEVGEEVMEAVPAAFFVEGKEEKVGAFEMFEESRGAGAEGWRSEREVIFA
jgi:hypothetical protein